MSEATPSSSQERQTSSVEDGGPDPRVYTDKGECEIVPSHGMFFGNPLSDLLSSSHVEQ